MNEDVRILIVDDEEDILEFLEYNLTKAGYTVSKASSGEEALASIEEVRPDLAILDIMMPTMDGIELCERIRATEENHDMLITFLTARSESFTQISALEAGADDYITKPIKPSLFVSKVKSILRRHPKLSEKQGNNLMTFGNLEINTQAYSVVLDGKTIILAKKEFELLALLASKPGKVFKRLEILHKVWGVDVIVGDRTIDVHIRKLREKIGSQYIRTLKGVGYKFEV